MGAGIKMTVRGSVACLVALVGLAASCGTENNPQVPRCIPGATQLCYGPGACRGAQQCLPDGVSYSVCDCGAVAGDGGAAGASSGEDPEAGASASAGHNSAVAGRGGQAGSEEQPPSSSGTGGTTAGAGNEATAGMSDEAAGSGGNQPPTFALDWARAVTTGASPQEIVADPQGGFHISGSLTTANFGNGEVKGNWFAVDRLANGDHVTARTLSSGSTPALYRAVRVGGNGTFVSVGGVDSYYDDLTYDTNELRISALPHFMHGYGAGKSTRYVEYYFALAVGAVGQVFYSSKAAVPFDGTNPRTTVVFSPAGEVGWASLDRPFAGAFLASGNLLMVGRLSGPQDFGGGTLTGGTYFVERDAAGNHVASWALNVNFGVPIESDAPYGTRLRSTPAYATIEGEVFGQASFPATLAGYDLALSGTRGWLTVVLDKAGHYRYAGVWPTVISDSGAALTPNLHAATDAKGRTFICGHFWRQLTAFGKTFSALGTSDKDSDIVLAALDVDGTVLFAKSFGAAGADVCTDIAIDSAGGVLVTGLYQTSLDFGAGALEAQAHAATDPRTFYIARFTIDE